MKNISVLIVDDDSIMRTSLIEALRRREGFNVVSASDGQEALQKIEKQIFDLVITDMKMPKASGLTVLSKVKKACGDTAVIVMTAYGTVDTAVKAMKEGAFDYLTKPFSVDELEVVVDKAVEHQKILDENRYLRDEINSEYNFGNIIGQSSLMRQVYDVINKVASSDASVLIHGESGTGKELVARAIHYNSLRRNNTFIKVNCAALSSNLLESELFGHEKGSFTNAVSRKLGRFELANKGTLFLDEISEMEPNLQAKLLRVLQEGEFDRVGGIDPIKTDVRIISTTNRKLDEEIKKEKFREDLFYRLNVVPIKLAPLRERKEDIPLLVKHFLDKYNRKNGKKIKDITKEAVSLMQSYSWPGNVRELENSIQRAVVLSSTETLSKEHFSFLDNGLDKSSFNKNLIKDNQVYSDDNSKTVEASGSEVMPLFEIEKKAIFDALSACGGNRTKAAEKLGITARTLRNKLKLFNEEKNGDLKEKNSFFSSVGEG